MSALGSRAREDAGAVRKGEQAWQGSGFRALGSALKPKPI